MGGMIFGLSRTTATEFSFFLAIPTMFAATFYDLYKHWGLLHAHDLAVFATGFVTAFVSAFFAVRALLRYIAHHSFVVFAWYRVVFCWCITVPSCFRVSPKAVGNGGAGFMSYKVSAAT